MLLMQPNPTPARFLLALTSLACAVTGSAAACQRWKNGPPHDDSFFPIAVWLQPPAKAAQYREAGFNTYVGLWKGPTEEQLAELKKSGMKLICDQNEVALRHLDDATIIGWMHGDEPDNAQELSSGKGYGPPILPEKIVADYQRIRAADPTRPVLLNLGQGVAFDDYIGRGVRRNHPEDYVEYVKGCDIASFDIYPVVHDRPEVAGKLWFVPQGVERLVRWAGPKRKATPQQVRAEAWMSLIHGSRGLIYFVHEWQPRFDESALLNDPEMLAAVTVLNRQITRLAPVLKRPALPEAASVSTEDPALPVATTVREREGTTYLFAAGMRDGRTSATFRVKGRKGDGLVEVLDENRTIRAKDGTFTDALEPWAVHLYALR
jgi:hypothetical protein